MSSPWLQHVKAFATANNLVYSHALKSAEVKADYQAKKAAKKTEAAAAVKVVAEPKVATVRKKKTEKPTALAEDLTKTIKTPRKKLGAPVKMTPVTAPRDLP